MEDLHLCYIIKVQFTVCYGVSLNTGNTSYCGQPSATFKKVIYKEKRFTLTKKTNVHTDVCFCVFVMCVI